MKITYTGYTQKYSTNYYSVDDTYFYHSKEQACLKAAKETLNIRGLNSLNEANLQAVLDEAVKQAKNNSIETSRSKLESAAQYWIK